MLSKIRSFIKKESVLCISAVFAVITMFFVPPDAEYFHYIDFRVLCLLFSLMGVVAGFKSEGIFSALTYQLFKRVRSGKLLGFTLVMLPFFTSMLVTNDVALIIFIPFTIALLRTLSQDKATVSVIVLQTVAANLGSMATPVGNPQNLFLYSKFTLSIGEFFSAVLPLTALSFLLLSVASLFLLPAEFENKTLDKSTIENKKSLLIYVVLFILSLLTVFRIVPYAVTALIVALVILIINKKIFSDIDFMLLATFVCFFIISENLGRVEAVRTILQTVLEKSVLFTGAGASQIISNVPAAVLLSAFTDDWKALIMGTNIGGLGTPIASLASLITLKIYMKSENSKTVKILLVFTAVNALLLAVLLVCSMVLK